MNGNHPLKKTELLVKSRRNHTIKVDALNLMPSHTTEASLRMGTSETLVKRADERLNKVTNNAMAMNVDMLTKRCEKQAVARKM